MMEEIDETVYALMMEALDGELTDSGLTELEAHLRVRPDLSREWQAMQAIDRLFRSTPALSPAADFTQRTLARLPNRRVRLWFVAAVYLLLLLVGLIPVVLLGWLAVQFAPALFEPAIVRTLVQAGSQLVSVIGAVLLALALGAGNYIRQQPLILVSLLVMLGAVAMWSGIYRQLVSAPYRRSND
jgi:anti-sigma factor RsiW